jgi:membrane protease YdiL (CAAX protease family)
MASVTSNAFIVLLLYLTATVAAGGLLAWPLSIALAPTIDASFHGVLSRTLLLTALLGVVLFLRATRRLNRAAAGFAADRRSFVRSLTVHFALGFLAIAALVAMLFAADVRFSSAESLDETLAQLLANLPLALVTGTVVGLFEETYFRGLVASAVSRRANAGSALIATSLFFAIAHFLVADAEPEQPQWYTGWVLVAEGLAGLQSAAAIGAFLALTAAGLLLGAMRVRDGHIGACAGFHAGWVTGYTLTHRLTDVTLVDGGSWLIGPDGVLGWLAFAWITALLLVYVFVSQRRGRSPSR